MKKVYNKSIKSDNVKRLRTLKGAEEYGKIDGWSEKDLIGRNIKKTVKDNVNVSVKASSPEELTELLGKMTPEQLEQLKEQLAKMETAKAVDGESEDRVNAEAEAATKETAEAATEKKDEE